jgi:thioredoxin 1
MAQVTIKKFSRKNCNPCKILSVYLREVDIEALNVILEEIDIEETPEVIEQYKIGSVPTLLFTRNGMEMSRIVGLAPVEEIEESIQHAKGAK